LVISKPVARNKPTYTTHPVFGFIGFRAGDTFLLSPIIFYGRWMIFDHYLVVCH